MKRCIGGSSPGLQPENCNGAGWDPGCVGRGVERRDRAGLMMMCGFDFGPDETRSLLLALLCLFAGCKTHTGTGSLPRL